MAYKGVDDFNPFASVAEMTGATEDDWQSPEQAQAQAGELSRAENEARQMKAASLAQEAQSVSHIKANADAASVPHQIDENIVAKVASGEATDADIAAAEAQIQHASNVDANVTHQQTSQALIGGTMAIAGATTASVVVGNFTDPRIEQMQESIQPAIPGMKTVANGLNNIEKSADGTTLSSAERSIEVADMRDDQLMNLQPLNTPGMGVGGISQGIV